MDSIYTKLSTFLVCFFVVCNISLAQNNKVGSKDCSTATQLCNNDVIDDQLLSPVNRIGSTNDIPTSFESCFKPKTERNPFWYQFTPENNGTFEMFLDASEGKDFDFIVFDVTNGCATKQLLTCNSSQLDLDSNSIGTGVSTDSLNKYNPDFPGILNPWASTINVTSGRRYAIYVENRFMTTLDSFQVKFGGTARFRNINAKFTTNAPYCFGKPVMFTNQSTGSGTITYLWNFGDGATSSQTNPVHSYTIPGKYWVKLTAGNGRCSYEDSLEIDVPITVVANAGADASVCGGKTANLLATGGTIFSWSPATGLSNPSISNPIASPTVTTNYVVTVTDAQGCRGTDNVTITVNPNPVVEAGNNVEICLGDSTQLQATGAVNYSWTPAFRLSDVNISNPFAKPTLSTSYAVTGTDALGCSAQDVVSVTVKPLPNANAGADATICNGQTTQLVATGGVSYSWSPSTALSNASIANPNATPKATTEYTVTVTGANGCKRTDNVIVNVDALPNISAGADVTICPGNSIGLSASGGVNYIWSPSTGLSNATVANPTASPSSTTTYTVTGTDNKGCTNTDEVVINVSATPTINAGVDVEICLDDSVALQASGGTNYIWQPSSSLSNNSISNPIAKPSTTTQYIVIADNGGCSGRDTVLVTVKPKPTVNAGNDVSICREKSTNLNASGGVTYVWVPTTGLSNPNIFNPVATPTSSTVYTVTATAANGCKNTDNVLVAIDALPNISAGSNQTICERDFANLQASGGVSYVWTPNVRLSNQNISNPTANPINTITYTVTGTDSKGCTNTDQVTIQVTPAPLVIAGIDKEVCSGDSVQFLASGAVNYNWQPSVGLSNSNIANPFAFPSTTTIYIVTGDNGTCSAKDTLVLTVKPKPTANAGNDVSVCTGKPALLNATGGGNYLWSPSIGLSNPNIRNPIANPIISTTYKLTVTNAQGCTDTDDINISVGANPNINIDANSSFVCSGSSTILKASGASSYIWTPSAGLSNTNIAEPTASPLTKTFYTVTGTDANGCQGTDTITIDVKTLPTASASNDDSTCIGISVQLNASGGSNYSWSPALGLDNPNVASPKASPTANTNYTVTVTDANGCKDTEDVFIKITNGTPVDAGSDKAFCFGKNVTMNASGNGNTFVWSPTDGLSNPNILNPIAQPTNTTKYFLSMIDSKGCTNIDSVLVEVNFIPIKVTSDTVLCESNSIQLNASGGNTYVWSPSTGLSNPNIANPVATLISNIKYRVDISDANGCSNFDSVNVVVSSIPTVSVSNDTTICNGNNALLQSSGGVSYLWTPSIGLSDPTIANPIASPSVNTKYVVKVSGANGCSSSDTVQVNVTYISITASNDTSICFGKTASLKASGGVNYSWLPIDGLDNPNIANPIANPTFTTEYAVTVTDAQGCKNTEPVKVNVSYINTTLSNDTSFCTGGSTQLLANGGVNYTWFPAIGLSSVNIPNPIASPTVSTKYFVVIADPTGCQNIDSVMIDVNPGPPVNAGKDTTVCNGITLNLLAQGALNYTWNPEPSLSATNIPNPFVSPSKTTSYIVEGSDASGCKAKDTIVVSLSFINITINGDTAVCNGNSANLNATGGLTYLWSPSTGLSATNIPNPVATVSNTTKYKVLITDSNGCQNTDSTTVNINNLPTVDAGSDVSICLGKSTLLRASGGTIFSWTPSLGLSDPNFFSPLASPGTTTKYFVDVTDARGCKGSDSVTVSVTVSLSGSATASPDTFCTGSPILLNAIAATGVNLDPLPYSFDGGLTFQANNNLTLPNVLEDTTAKVLIKDLSGCLSDTIQVNMIRRIFLAKIEQLSPVTCAGLNNGVAQISQIVGGVKPYEFYQEETQIQSDSVFNNLSAGNQVFFVRDQSKCVSRYNLSITVNPSIDKQIFKTDAKCFGGNDGSIEVNVSGGSGTGFTYSIDGKPFENTNIFSNLAVGPHSLVVKDNLDCKDTTSVIINSPNALNIQVVGSPKNVNCFGGSDGEILFSALGGVRTYQYSLGGFVFQSDSIFKNLNSNSYRGFVADANGCKDSIDFIIRMPDSIRAAFTILQHPKCTGIEGIVKVDSIRGGTPNYTKIINGDVFTTKDTLTGLFPGEQIITVRDNNGCENNFEIAFEIDSNAVRATINSDSTFCFGSSEGKISLSNIEGGIRPYRFSLGDTLNFVPDTMFAQLKSGTYRIYAKNANNCLSQFTTIVNSPDTIIAKLVAQKQVSCYGLSDGEISVIANGGNGLFTYTIDKAISNTTGIFMNRAAITDTIFVSDRKNCKSSYVFTITQPDSLFANVSELKPASCEGGDGEAIVRDIKGGNGSKLFSINNGDNFQSDTLFSKLNSGAYTLLMKDANQCSRSLEFVINSFPAGLEVAAINKEIKDIACRSDVLGSVKLSNFVGAPAPYSFALDTSTSFKLEPEFANLDVGAYTIKIKDGNKCNYSISVSIEKADTINFTVQALELETCINADGKLMVTNVTGASGKYIYKIDNNLAQTDTIFSNLTKGIKLITVSDSILPSCASNIAFELKQKPGPRAFTTIQNISCFGSENGSITIDSVVGGKAPYLFSLDNETFSSENTFQNLKPDTNSLWIKDSQCSVAYTNLESKITIVDNKPDTTFVPYFVITQPEKFTAETFYFEDPNQENIAISGIYNFNGGTKPYFYSTNDTTYQKVNSDTLFINNLTEGNYTVFIKDTNSCKEQLAIKIGRTFMIPNLFTPNGDTKNDYFEITGLRKKSSLVITNRWGAIVYQNEDYDNSWDGADCVDGVYYYELKIPNVNTYKGWIQIANSKK